jgi:hypothetical protein
VKLSNPNVTAIFIKIVSVAVLICPSMAQSQSLDDKAWNAVWDKLEKIVPKGNATNVVHILEIPVAATWASRDEEGLRELQHYAGAIPEDTYTIDPSRTASLLHQVYAAMVLDLELPRGTDADRASFLAASKKYKAAFKNFNKDLAEYLKLWEKRKAELKENGQAADDLARLRFRTEQGGSLVDAQNQLKDAFLDVQHFAPVAQYWVNAVSRLNTEVTGAASIMNDIYTYEGGFATLKKLKETEDCKDDSDRGWDKITFSKATTSEHTRQDHWNGNGGWGGSFFNIGGGASGSDYSHWLNTATDNITVGFCSLTYVPLGPGGWFVPELLRDIDAGRLKVKDGPQKGKKAFGPDGVIPRIVKGAIVARRIAFSAKLGTTAMSEYRREISGSAGVRVGPWHIGGGGGHTEFGKETNDQNGGYVRSTDFTDPVIVAIITEPTSDLAGQPTKADPSKQ